MLYVRLAILAAFLAVCGLALWYRGEAISAESDLREKEKELAGAVAANDAYERAMNRLLVRQEDNNRLIANLIDQVTSINDTMAETSTAIAELEKVNEDVKAYMAVTIPDDLRKLLNNP